MITPTIGRKVWFRPTEETRHDRGITCLDPSQPFDADIVFVHDDRRVNLFIRDHQGSPMKFTDVTLRQPEDEAPAGDYAEWMPYQAAQAAAAAAAATPAA